MAVRIRLRRIGKRKQPQYRLIVAEAAGPRDGRFIEAIGHYNPRLDPAAVSVNEERALWWLQQGAQPSDTAKSMLAKTGVWEKFSGEPAPVAAQPRAAASEPEPEAPAEKAEAGDQQEEVIPETEAVAESEESEQAEVPAEQNPE